jgi:prophage DNA circulation protein
MATGDSTTVFSRYRVASWKAKGGSEIKFPITKITESYKNRVIARERPYKDGAKLDDTGAMAVTWELEVIIHNGHEEPDLDGDNLYPQVANDLSASATIHETGDLQLPTRGKKRARLVEYRRVEDAAQEDCAAFIFTFQEDSEDSVIASSFTAPSAKAVAKAYIGACVDECAVQGAWSDPLAALSELAADLEALANAPGDFAADLEAKANAVFNKINEVQSTFTEAAANGGKELATLLTHPEASLAGRLLGRAADTAKRASAGVLGAGHIITRTWPREMSIFDIATELAQPVDKLLIINAGIPNNLAIPPKTPVRVYDTAA